MLAAEKAARELAEMKFEKEVYAAQRLEATFKAMGSTSPLAFPALVQALSSVGELTEMALQ